jgi:zinc/manganese transport system permease protein
MEIGIWEIMAPPFFECLILVGIHSYLGLHVIRRKVIFVDLSLAQIAALGTTVGFLFGIMPDTTGAYVFSIGFTLIGAVVFSLTRFRHEKIPQEAVIGLTYAIAASIAILVIDKAPHGAEHIKEIVSGNLLWVKWSTVIKGGIVYALVGLFHFIFRRNFILISENPEQAYGQGIPVRFWDFLFYVSFGIIITHSVVTAGVLLVFIFLVVPAIVATLLTDNWSKQLLIGWILGLLVTMTGLLTSYQLDLPSGPSVVATYAIALILIVLVLYVARAQQRMKALRRILLGMIVVSAIIAGFIFMGTEIRKVYHIHEHHGPMTEEEHLLHEVQVHKKLSVMSEEELKSFLWEIKQVDILHKIFDAESDPYIRYRISEQVFRLNKRTGLELMYTILVTCEFPYLREEIIEKFQTSSGENFGFDSARNPDQNKEALDQIKIWLKNYAR